MALMISMKIIMTRLGTRQDGEDCATCCTVPGATPHRIRFTSEVPMEGYLQSVDSGSCVEVAVTRLGHAILIAIPSDEVVP